MLYNRWWFKKDLYAITLGGGAMANPGRYLTLLPPINGANAISGTPYFTQNPGDPFKARDASLTFDWMPRQYITFRAEYGYRHANVPYFTGRGGITPGDNLSPSTIPNPGAGLDRGQHDVRAGSSSVAYARLHVCTRTYGFLPGSPQRRTEPAVCHHGEVLAGHSLLAGASQELIIGFAMAELTTSPGKRGLSPAAATVPAKCKHSRESLRQRG